MSVVTKWSPISASAERLLLDALTAVSKGVWAVKS